MSSSRAPVVIIGGGASGVLIAGHLSRHPGVPDRPIVVVERSGELGRGVAYGTTSTAHVLNVPASGMSARAEDPMHFVEWLGGREPTSHPRTFAPRPRFARYLHDEASGLPRLDAVAGEAVDIWPRPGGGEVEVELRDGRRLRAGRVVLATGHQPPSDPAAVPDGVRRSGRYLDNPWDVERLGRIPDDARVALLGSGLSAVDVALLLDQQGHRGPVVAFSRHGRSPQAHREEELSSPRQPPAGPVPATARALLRSCRRDVEAVRSVGGDWRPVVDGYRPRAQEIWLGLPFAERARFARHLASLWDVHRHRVAPEVGRRLTALAADARWTVRAGRLHRCHLGRGSLVLELGPGPDVERADYLINCTGPRPALRRPTNPLIAALAARDLIRADPLGLGLDADPDGTVHGADGHPSSWLHAVGPLLRGVLWETTAVPEIRGQARRFADRVAGADRRAAPPDPCAPLGRVGSSG